MPEQPRCEGCKWFVHGLESICDSRESLRAKCDALAKEVAELKEVLRVVNDRSLEMTKQLKEIGPDLEAMRKDAARWKFFRECSTPCQERDVLNIAEMEHDEVDAYFDRRMEHGT